MARPPVIRKAVSDLPVTPNWADYQALCASFSWPEARRDLAGLPGGGLNIAFELRDIVIAQLKSIAPEVDGDQLVASLPLREQVDLDSMDWLNFLIGLHNKLAVEIPEADYAKLRTLDDLLARS